MKKLFITLIAGLSVPTFAMTADEIMQQVDQIAEPQSMKSNMTMVLVDNKGKQRVRSMQSVSADIDGVDKSLMFFLEPNDVKGTGFLMFDYEAADADDDQWMLLPSLGKAKRIASGDKTGSFMGSDFTYADMSKRNLEEWTYELVKEDDINGVKVWVIESTPVSDAVIEKTGYTKSIAYVRQDNFHVTRGI
ncbi:MAG: outer membrane lipoprotein-sorting protein, partial [Reinekea sp.]|nr:outer membrane lipoprotein-sorting protein [Reinekea sp.]